MRKKKNVYDELPDYEEENEYQEELYDDYQWEEEEKPRRSSRGRHVKPKAKPSRKKRIGRGILIGILAVVLIVVIAVFFLFRHVYGMMNIDERKKGGDSTPAPAVTEVTPEPASPTPTAEPTATPEPLTEEELLMQELEMEAAELVYNEDVYNILLIGNDTRDFEQAGRTDAMFILTINKATKEMWLTSFQRDIWIDIPGNGSAKLNAANVYGGIDLLIQTLEQGFGVKIDNYVSVNFDEFIALADMAGGITVDMTADEIYYMNLHIMEVNIVMGIEPSNEGIIWDLVDGTYHLDGRQTLGYCKMRELDGTTARSARQRDALMQMWGNVREMSLVEMYKLVEKAMSIITTDMTQGECASLLLLAPSLLKYDMEAHQIPVEGGYFRTRINGQGCYWLDYNVNRAYLRATIYGQDVDAKSLTTDIAGYDVQVYYPEENAG